MDHQRLIEALADPSAYPLPVETVELRQTHISTVFLAGLLAYKIKKPVDLGFVDYTTLERRFFYCEEEVRLNARLAPGIYLGVVPIARQGGTIRMEGNGEVVEWAVKMRRLPDAATLGAYLDRDQVGGEAIEQLARRIARFHATADASGSVAAGANFDVVARNARDNFDQSAHLVGVTLSQATFDRLKARTDVSLARLRGLIEDRARGGIAREIHGDLRLEHVYWFPDQIPPRDWIVVDCIEFDARFRHGDPVADIAFLSMELKLRGRDDLARLFLDAYFRASGDEQGRSLVPFYMAYRAAVRAKVEGMKLAESEIPETERSAARTHARALWLFAVAQLENADDKPSFVLIAGLPGSGKSTLARELAARSDFAVIRSDAVRKALAAKSGPTVADAPADKELYTTEWNDRTYAECLRLAKQGLFEGRRVLVDASFHKESWRRRFLEAARESGVTGCLLVCQAEPAVIRDRLARRRDDVSDADGFVYEDMARRWQEPGPATRKFMHEIASGGTLDDSLAQALAVLQEIGLRNRDG